MHLTPAAFIDLVDGATAESDVPHLAGCAACRDQLDALHRMTSQVDTVSVPEPSPMFWEHLSARVREAVAAESSTAPWWSGGGWRITAVVATAAAALAVVVVAPRMLHRPAAPIAAEDQVSAISTAGVNDQGGDDPLDFMTDLAAGVDWDAVDAVGLVDSGGPELALAQMDPAERIELQRLLNDALTRGGRRWGAPGT